MVNVLSHYGRGIERAIKTPVKVKNLVTNLEISTMGLWDTGATGSAITSVAAKKLGLIPISMTEVSGVHGTEIVPVYSVVLTLNNENISVPVRVTEGKASSFSIEGDADILIGMDIITMGDYSITNCNGRTVMSFRFPSLETIDYCNEVNEHNRYLKIHELNLKKHLPDKCGCGSGKLYKNCHGLSPYHKA